MNRLVCIAIVWLASPAAMTFGQRIRFEMDDRGAVVFAKYFGDSKWLVEQKDPKSHLHLLPDLEEIHLQNHWVSRAGMKYVAGLKKLIGLQLGDGPEGVECDEGVMEELAAAKQIEWLWICKDNLKDADLKWIATMPKVIDLSIQRMHDDRSDIEDGLLAIAAMRNLENLTLWSGTKVSDRVVEQLATLPKLSSLNVYSDQLTDKTVDTIASRMKLRELEIHSSSLSARGIEQLKNISRLKTLVINGKTIRRAPPELPAAAPTKRE